MMPLRIAIALAVAVLSGCSLAPQYENPSMPVADHYKEAGPWQPAAPNDAVDRGDWWRSYGDTALDALEQRLDASNPNLAAAADRYAAARSLAAEARAGMFPQLDASAAATHNRQSDHRPLRSSSQPDEYRDDSIGAQLGYELDLWGRVRNSIAAGEASAQASAADFAAARLGLHAELANDYIALRNLDAEVGLLTDTVDAYTKALTLTQNRYKGGIASGLDVARAQTQLDTARAQATDAHARRTLFEHAVATLVGESATTFELAPQIVNLPVPAIPVGVPSTLLERRPDVAAAERRMAAANAEIGVARAAFFPSITLTASGGYESTGTADWLTAPNTFWSIGPHALVTLFDAGRRHARVQGARAAFDEASERYRATALGAFQQVEDNLALLHLLGDEARDESAAVQSAQRTVDLALNRYRNGAVNYLEVVTAQTAALQAQRSALDLQARRLLASVALVRALGGGWSASDLPSSSAMTTSQVSSTRTQSPP